MTAKRSIRRKCGWLALAMMACVPAGIAVTAPTEAQIPIRPKYTVTDLGALPDEHSNSSRAYAINNAAQVAGESRVSAGWLAVLWNGTTPTNLGTLPGYSRDSYAYGINSFGQVVGVSYGFLSSRGVVWDGRNMIELGTFGADRSEAYGINDSGFVVGSADVPWSYTSFPRAFIWKDLNADGQDDPGEMQQLLSYMSAALAINKHNMITGWFSTPDSDRHAFRYFGGEMTDLGTFGGARSCGYGVNEAGLIVGEAENAFHRFRAFVWEPRLDPVHGSVWSMRDLGTLPGYRHSVAFGINKNGMIVGRVHNNQTRFLDDTDRAVRFVNGAPQNLNSLIPANSGWTLLEARGVNDAGQIVGVGIINGKLHAFRLDPLSISP